MSPAHTTRCYRLILIFLLTLPLCPSGRAQTSDGVPSGDRLFVGSMTGTAWTALQALPIPKFDNQKFCDTVQMASGFFREAYVPTMAERNGDFSAFNGKLLDPLADNAPFPGGVI